MKKIIFLIACLAFASLACLESAAVVGPAQTEMTTTPEPTFVTQTIAISKTLTPTLSLKGEGEETCARVIAIEALNVRFGASDQDHVLTWLKSGELVQVVDRSDADWWKIERHGVIGFARSSYLEEVECGV